MGKATIISHAGHGQYTVDVEIDTTYLTQIINQLDAEYARLLFTDKANAEAAESAAASALSTAQAAVDAAIFAYQLDPTEEKRQAIDAAAIEAVKAIRALPHRQAGTGYRQQPAGRHPQATDCAAR